MGAMPFIVVGLGFVVLWGFVSYSTIQRISDSIREVKEYWLTLVMDKINLVEKIELAFPNPQVKEPLPELKRQTQLGISQSNPLVLDQKVNAILQQFLDQEKISNANEWPGLKSELTELRQKSLTAKRKLQVLEEDYEARTQGFPNRLLLSLFKV